MSFGEGPWDATAPRNAFERSSKEYEDFRPSYPNASVRAALGSSAGFVPRGFDGPREDSIAEDAPARPLTVIDMGAGTGKFTSKLVELGLDVWAVEPAAAMRKLLLRAVQARRRDAKIVEAEPSDLEALAGGPGTPAGKDARSAERASAELAGTEFAGGLATAGQIAAPVPDPGAPRAGAAPAPVQERASVTRIRFAKGPDLKVVNTTAEHTGLDGGVADVITFAQSWHWMNQEAASAEAARLLRPGGHVSIIFNQMDVSIPWVHRLTRIMRSGDVHTPQKVPRLGEGWAPPSLHRTDFSTRLTPAGVMALARTRSSYLKSTPANRAKMQANLEWYLHEHLGYDSDDLVEIPYYCLVWNTFYTPAGK